jgi:uncharacterized protein YceK
MKNILLLIVVVIFLVGCSQSVTMQQAANRSYKSSRSVR